MPNSFRSALLLLLLLTAVEIEAQGNRGAQARQRAASNGGAQARQRAASSNDSPSLEIYGFVMTDFGFDFGRINPEWFDTLRPTQLPSFEREFGRDGSIFSGVRQTRFGVKGFEPTKFGELKTLFEWDLLGSGPDSGETTFKLRHAYGEIGRFGGGQTWSPFANEDIVPKTLEYMGPNGMSKIRTIQVRWMPIQGDTRLTFALEKPGSIQDPGRLENLIDEQNVVGRFPYPDLSGQFRWARKRGYIQASGVIGETRLDDLLDNHFNFDQTIKRWGIDLSTKITAGAKDALKAGYVFGQGMENYVNDAPVSIAATPNFGNPLRPFKGEALPFRGLTAFYEHYWNDRWSTTAGYSQVVIYNTILQNPDQFHRGQYSIANLLYYPAENIMLGGEAQWARRTNFGDGFHSNDYKVQFSFKFSFKGVIGGNP
jgi:hypothetical protein